MVVIVVVVEVMINTGRVCFKCFTEDSRLCLTGFSCVVIVWFGSLCRSRGRVRVVLKSFSTEI